MAKRKQRDQNGKQRAGNPKMRDLATFRESPEGQHLTTDQGLRINDDQNSLKAGERGGSLLEDFILREKITHFDHERIPERVVHARGAGAHGERPRGGGALRAGISRWTTGDGLFAVRDRKIFVDELRLNTGPDQMLVEGSVNFAREADLTIRAGSSAKHEKRAENSGRVLKVSGPLSEPKVTVEKLVAAPASD
jgi:hypothetical protein